MGGLIHDMDMAGRLHRLPEQYPPDEPTSTADLLAMLLDTPGPLACAEQPVGHQKGFRTVLIFSSPVAPHADGVSTGNTSVYGHRTSHGWRASFSRL
jgi:hypothetical protein